jgi:hypothetical protein
MINLGKAGGRRLRSTATLGSVVLALASVYACSGESPENETAVQNALPTTTTLDVTAPACGAPTASGVLRRYSDGATTIQNQAVAFDVLTQHNDIARSGAATHENILTPASVKSGQFGYLGSVPVEGKIYAQPLYVEKAAVKCGGAAVRNANIAYVATLENIVYAIDVDSQQVCWSTPRLGCGQDGGGLLGFDPQAEGGVRVGIVSTPVVDLAKNALYAVSREWTGTAARFWVNTIDTRTGALAARVEVTAGANTGCGANAFDPGAHNNRPGLLLAQNKLFLAFGSTIGEDDRIDYHGFVIGFDVSNPARPTRMPRVFCATPTTKGGGIWMAGSGLASDGQSIYFSTGNGAYKFDGDVVDSETKVPNYPPAGNYPESFVKLNVDDLSVQSAYTDVRKQAELGSAYIFDAPNTPDDKKHTMFWARERSDADLGSGGVLLVGNRLMGGGKDGRMYALDTSGLGLSHVQSFQAFFDADTDEGTNTSYYHTYNYRTTWYDGANMHGSPIAWDVTARGGNAIYVYGWSEKDTLKRFTLQRDTGMFQWPEARDATAADPSPSPHGSIQSAHKSMPGGMLALSANGASDGIVWAVLEEPFAPSRAQHPRCGPTSNNSSECEGCFLSNGRFSEHCDATRGYVPGRLYAFAADDNGAGVLPLLWGDKRTASPNNLIPRYSKFTPPTVAHGKIIVPTGNNEVRFYGLRNCTTSPCTSAPRRADELVAPWNDAGSATLAMYASTKTRFTPHTQWNIRDGGWGDEIRWLPGDFDGDGRSDVAAVWNNGGQNTLTVRRSTGSAFTHEHWIIGAGPWLPSSKWVSGDFNGDGLSDIAVIWNDGNAATTTVYLSAGNRFAKPVVWSPRDGGWGDGIKWVAGDYNGDGLTDIAAIWNDGGTNTLTVRQSTRSSFIPRHWDIHDGGWMDTTAWLAGDFDGDGLTDIAAAWNDGGFATFAMFRSRGQSFAPHTQWKPRDGGWGDDVRWVAGDYNADGFTDIAAIWNDGGYNTLTVRESTGATFNTVHWDIRDGGWMDSTKWVVGKYH